MSKGKELLQEVLISAHEYGISDYLNHPALESDATDCSKAYTTLLSYIEKLEKVELWARVYLKEPHAHDLEQYRDAVEERKAALQAALTSLEEEQPK
jgi:hypothetical protein